MALPAPGAERRMNIRHDPSEAAGVALPAKRQGKIGGRSGDAQGKGGGTRYQGT